MKWPQFDLWRLFVATALFAVGLGVLRAAWLLGSPAWEPLVVLATTCFGSAIGLLFRQLIPGALIGYLFPILIVFAAAAAGINVVRD